MLPISDVPLSLREFGNQFRGVFTHPAQRAHFELMLAGIMASPNCTVAGIHQVLTDDVGYKGLWNFMADSPWDHEELREKRLEWTAEQLKTYPGIPRVAVIDSTLIHHSSDQIHGVYWYYDYVNHNFCLGQKIVVSSFVAPGLAVPLGMKLYHRGFLTDQKLYLEATKPSKDAPQEEWDEYHSCEKY